MLGSGRGSGGISFDIFEKFTETPVKKLYPVSPNKHAGPDKEFEIDSN